METKGQNKPNKILNNKKSRLISFLNRQNSLSCLIRHRTTSSLESGTPTPRLSRGNLHKDTENCTPKSVKSTSKSPNRIKLTENNLDRIKLSERNSSTTPKKGSGDYVTLEILKQKLSDKEKDLETREKNLKNQEKILEDSFKSLNENLSKLKLKEKELNKKEMKLAASKQEIFKIVSDSLEQKSKEISEQERKLQQALKNISKEMEVLKKTKEEVVKQECSLLLNEMIGHIVLFDFQSRTQSRNESYEESEYVCGDLEKIDEASNESSSKEINDSYSLEFTKKKDQVLMTCVKITKENKFISQRIEEILASLNTPIEITY
jgi:hypothetical protein